MSGCAAGSAVSDGLSAEIGRLKTADGVSDGLFLAVELFEQFVGFVGVFVAQDAQDVLFEAVDAAVDDDVFHGQQVVGVHGEAAQPHTQQQAGVEGVAGHFAAEGDGFVHALGGAQDVGEQAQNGGS